MAEKILLSGFRYSAFIEEARVKRAPQDFPVNSVISSDDGALDYPSPGYRQHTTRSAFSPKLNRSIRDYVVDSPATHKQIIYLQDVQNGFDSSLCSYRYPTNTDWTIRVIAPPILYNSWNGIQQSRSPAEFKDFVSDGTTHVACYGGIISSQLGYPNSNPDYRDGGAIIWTTDGIFWNRGIEDWLVGLPDNYSPYGQHISLTHFGGKWGCLVDSSSFEGFQALLVSTNSARNWAFKPIFPVPPGSRNLYSVATNGSVFVVVGEGVALVSSDDGDSWTDVLIPDGNLQTNGDYVDVHYANGVFVAVGGPNRVAYSSNGTSWTHTFDNWYIAGWSNEVYLSKVLYGGGTWLAYEMGSSTYIYSRNNGVTWTRGQSPYPIKYVNYTDGLFHAISTVNDKLMKSLAGDSWTVTDKPDFSSDIVFVAQARDNPTIKVQWSDDGGNWVNSNLTLYPSELSQASTSGLVDADDVNDPAWWLDDKEFFYISGYRSPDGKNWLPYTFTSSDTISMYKSYSSRWDDGQNIFYDYNRVALRSSPDFINWSVVNAVGDVLPANAGGSFRYAYSPKKRIHLIIYRVLGYSNVWETNLNAIISKDDFATTQSVGRLNIPNSSDLPSIIYSDGIFHLLYNEPSGGNQYGQLILAESFNGVNWRYGRFVHNGDRFRKFPYYKDLQGTYWTSNTGWKIGTI